jgi:hypothetical protein
MFIWYFLLFRPLRLFFCSLLRHFRLNLHLTFLFLLLYALLNVSLARLFPTHFDHMLIVVFVGTFYAFNLNYMTICLYLFNWLNFFIFCLFFDLQLGFNLLPIGFLLYDCRDLMLWLNAERQDWRFFTYFGRLLVWENLNNSIFIYFFGVENHWRIVRMWVCIETKNEVKKTGLFLYLLGNMLFLLYFEDTTLKLN